MYFVNTFYCLHLRSWHFGFEVVRSESLFSTEDILNVDKCVQTVQSNVDKNSCWILFMMF